MMHVEPTRTGWREDEHMAGKARAGASKVSPARRTELQCAACASRANISLEVGVPFCVDCLERSRQAKLSEFYDDLGGQG
jgi:hypothetical protein